MRIGRNALGFAALLGGTSFVVAPRAMGRRPGPNFRAAAACTPTGYIDSRLRRSLPFLTIIPAVAQPPPFAYTTYIPAFYTGAI